VASLENDGRSLGLFGVFAVLALGVALRRRRDGAATRSRHATGFSLKKN
jgi:hypothetical protein